MPDNSGTYKSVNGKIVKISDRIPSIKKVPEWARNLDADTDKKMTLQSLGERGKIKPSEYNDVV